MLKPLPIIMPGLRFVLVIACTLLATNAHSEPQLIKPYDLSSSWTGYLALSVFCLAYVFVVLEEKIHLRKSKPVLLAASLIWIIIAFAYHRSGDSELIEPAIRHNFLEYSELFFFLLVAMTYINAMVERGLFDDLRYWLISKGFSYRQLFWFTGFLAFVISPIADNLTTALILCAVVIAVANGKSNFVSVSCVNIVVAANAGGAFSPFGDITTLMVWQKGIIEFSDFFALFLPSLVNFLVPASIMHFAIHKGTPDDPEGNARPVKFGGVPIAILFILTIATAVTFHSVLHIPPVFGMLTGLAYLKFYGYFLNQKSKSWNHGSEYPPGANQDPYDFDVFSKIAHAEWDTLFFFYGVIMAVGGLGFLGYLGISSEYIYGEFGATNANIMVGVLSALIDNIPVMYAILTMNPDMPHVQWLLVTLTAGVGGSLLSIGSAAGVALMGQARGKYTFFSHLRWTPVIALGYAASIWVHLLINS
ncbi:MULTISPECIES: sodium:proton antiporter NhaD [unclassified Oleiphilus]|nr:MULTISPECIES: sodium:proton antiporter NhaD [unclassified Oleiphilus]